MAPTQTPAGHYCVLYFAAAATYTGLAREDFPAPIKARELFAKLEEKHPGIKDKVLSSCAVTVNLEYIDIDDGDASDLDREINQGDEVAIIPPVSSG